MESRVQTRNVCLSDMLYKQYFQLCKQSIYSFSLLNVKLIIFQTLRDTSNNFWMDATWSHLKRRLLWLVLFFFLLLLLFFLTVSFKQVIVSTSNHWGGKRVKLEVTFSRTEAEVIHCFFNIKIKFRESCWKMQQNQTTYRYIHYILNILLSLQ